MRASCVAVIFGSSVRSLPQLQKLRMGIFQQLFFGANIASETISECLILKIFFGGACPQIPLACSHLFSCNGRTSLKQLEPVLLHIQTERLCALLTASNSHHRYCIYRICFDQTPQLLFFTVSFFVATIRRLFFAWKPADINEGQMRYIGVIQVPLSTKGFNGHYTMSSFPCNTHQDPREHSISFSQ